MIIVKSFGAGGKLITKRFSSESLKSSNGEKKKYVYKTVGESLHVIERTIKRVHTDFPATQSDRTVYIVGARAFHSVEVRD